jgi:hypothetical protein
MPVGDIDYLQLWNVEGNTINPGTDFWWGNAPQFLGLPGNPVVYNVTLVLANTQYSQLVSNPTMRRLRFQALQPVAICWATATGKVAGPVAPYSTLAAGVEYEAPSYIRTGTSRASLTLYFASSVAGTIVQILVFA